MKYDPENKPDPQEWLELDEQGRIMLVEDYHKAARIKLPNLTLHSTVHVIVENQIAQGLDSAIREMTSQQKSGLSRHDALHAVGADVANLIFELLNKKAK